MILFTSLLLAHLIGDFLLQPKSWVKDKEAKKLKSTCLYLHVLLHGALVLLLTWNLKYWPVVIGVVCSHFFIDVLKLYRQTEQTRQKWFLLDQALHLGALLLIWGCWQQPNIVPTDIFTPPVLIIATAVTGLSVPTSMLIKSLLSYWTPSRRHEDESLENAGKYIGILERLFVLIFVLSGHLSAVGVLLAAKSVFRFGDLRESKDRKLTEYILIGTLLSIGISMLTGMLALYLLNR